MVGTLTINEKDTTDVSALKKVLRRGFSVKSLPDVTVSFDKTKPFTVEFNTFGDMEDVVGTVLGYVWFNSNTTAVDVSNVNASSTNVTGKAKGDATVTVYVNYKGIDNIEHDAQCKATVQQDTPPSHRSPLTP